MSNISNEAAGAREAARQGDGKFGEQAKSDPGQIQIVSNDDMANMRVCSRCGGEEDVQLMCPSGEGHQFSAASLNTVEDLAYGVDSYGPTPVILPEVGAAMAVNVTDSQVDWVSSDGRQGTWDAGSDDAVIFYPRDRLAVDEIRSGDVVRYQGDWCRTYGVFNGKVELQGYRDPVSLDADNGIEVQVSDPDSCNQTADELRRRVAERSAAKLNDDEDLASWHTDAVQQELINRGARADDAEEAAKRAERHFSKVGHGTELEGRMALAKGRCVYLRPEVEHQYQGVKAGREFSERGLVPDDRRRSFEHAVATAASARDTSLKIAVGSHDYVVVDAGSRYDVYAASAWQRPETPGMLPWSKPTGQPVAIYSGTEHDVRPITMQDVDPDA